MEGYKLKNISIARTLRTSIRFNTLSLAPSLQMEPIINSTGCPNTGLESWGIIALVVLNYINRKTMFNVPYLTFDFSNIMKY